MVAHVNEELQAQPLIAQHHRHDNQWATPIAFAKWNREIVQSFNLSLLVVVVPLQMFESRHHRKQRAVIVAKANTATQSEVQIHRPLPLLAKRTVFDRHRQAPTLNQVEVVARDQKQCHQQALAQFQRLRVKTAFLRVESVRRQVRRVALRHPALHHHQAHRQAEAVRDENQKLFFRRSMHYSRVLAVKRKLCTVIGRPFAHQFTPNRYVGSSSKSWYELFGSHR